MRFIDNLNEASLSWNFSEMQWSYELLIVHKTKSRLWMIELESDEDGYIPKKIWTILNLENNVEIGDLLRFSHYLSEEPKTNLDKKPFDEKAFSYFADWFDEQTADKNLKNPFRIDLERD